MEITDEQITEILEYCENATQGPWVVTDGQHIDQYAPHPDGNRLLSEGSYDANYHLFSTSDVTFIARARTDLPRLALALREARAEIVRLRATRRLEQLAELERD